MRKYHSVSGVAAGLAACLAFAVSAGTNDTARINASIIPMIQIGGEPAPGDPNDPTHGGAVAEGNNLGGVIGGIAYGQTYQAAPIGDGRSFVATGSWLIHSNSQVNSFACSGTDLYKAAVNPANASNYNTQPIPLDVSQGAYLNAALSNDLSGGQGFTPLNGSEVSDSSNSNWVFKQSGFVTFHGAEQQVTQWVSCKLTWTHNNFEKAQGIYIGYMRIYAMNAGNY